MKLSILRCQLHRIIVIQMDDNPTINANGRCCRLAEVYKADPMTANDCEKLDGAVKAMIARLGFVKEPA
jgi:hypothetical protein